MIACRQRRHRNSGAACRPCLSAGFCALVSGAACLSGLFVRFGGLDFAAGCRARHFSKFSGLLALCLLLITAAVSASEDTPDESALPPAMQGRFVSLDSFRLRVDCTGSGDVTILFEPGLGGSAFEWQPLQQALQKRARTCIYDRAGYGWSGPSPYPRTARQLAAEADEMLSLMDIKGPLILVGHSFGGFVMRLLALRREDEMLALVLIDSSHERQLERLEKLNGRSMMPSGSSFVISPADIPASLPADVQASIRRFSRMRKTYAALHSEMSRFRESADQVRMSRRQLPYPVAVIRRGRDLHAEEYKGALKTAIWEQLQQDLVNLSAQGRLIVAEQSGHHVHADQPELVVDVIISLLDEYTAAQSAVRR